MNAHSKKSMQCLAALAALGEGRTAQQKYNSGSIHAAAMGMQSRVYIREAGLDVTACSADRLSESSNQQRASESDSQHQQQQQQE